MRKIHIDKIHVIVAVLLSLLSIQLFMGLQYKSATADELMDLSAGYFYLKTGDFGLNPTHPPLGRMMSATPLLFLDLNFSKEWESAKAYSATEFPIDLFYIHNNVDIAFFWGRIPVIIVSLILGLYIFLWTSKLFGRKAALFALFLYSFNPMILGHFTLTMTDPFITVFSFITTYHFWIFLKNPNRRNLIISGLTLGLAVSSKATGIFLVPVFLILIIINSRLTLKRLFSGLAIKKLLAIFFIALVVLIGVYGFEFRTIRSVTFNEDNLARFDEMAGTPLGYFINNVPVPLTFLFKGLYIESIPGVVGGKGPVYLFGELNTSSFLHYFIVGFLIKNPIPLLIFLALAIIMFFLRRCRKDILTELTIILPIIAWMLFFSFSKLGFGVRHILPIFPFLFLFMSRIVNTRFRFRNIILVVLGAWYVVSSILIFPNYISYFNEFVGSENGYNYFIGYQGTGENMKPLKGYMETNNIDNIKLAKYGYWISHEAIYRNISYEDFCGKTDGIVVVDIRYLKGVRGNHTCYEWLEEYKPIESIGYSILVYNITT